jgi:hypothetical protein
MPRSVHAKTIAAIKRNRTKRLASLVTKSYMLHRRKQDETMYNLICEEFVSLGGVYIKFLQGVLLRSQVMRKWHNPEKLKIFENLESEPLDIGKLLQHELGKEKLSQIALVQPQPFAAGSFGQVYYAQLRTGEPVIVKVLRPMVRELLKYDIKLLTTFSRAFFVKLYKNMNIQLSGALKEFSEATLRETDYKHEAEFAMELYNSYKDHPTLVIPKTYLELCTDNIIVQDYVDGISVAQIIKMHEQGVDPVQYVKEQLGSDLITQLRMLGYESVVAAIRIMTKNRVGLIDFGISARAPKDKSGLFGLFDSYDKLFKGSQTTIGLFEHSMRFFVGDLYRSLRRLGDYVGQNNPERDYVNEVSQIASDVFEKATGTSMIAADFKNDSSVLVTVNKMVNKGNRFGLVMKLEATEMLRAVQTFTGLLGSLGLYSEVMPDIMDRAVHDLRLQQPQIAQEAKGTVSIGDALEVVTAWLERVADRDPLLFRQLSEKIRNNTAAVIVPEGKKKHA